MQTEAQLCFFVRQLWLLWMSTEAGVLESTLKELELWASEALPEASLACLQPT